MVLKRLTDVEELKSGMMLETTTEIFYNVVQKSYLEAIQETGEETQQREKFLSLAFKMVPWERLLIGWNYHKCISILKTYLSKARLTAECEWH